MLVTTQKRAEINDMLLGTFDYTKEKVLADRVMDIRVLKEFGKNEFYHKVHEKHRGTDRIFS